jgi:hypothetical protein
MITWSRLCLLFSPYRGTELHSKIDRLCWDSKYGTEQKRPITVNWFLDNSMNLWVHVLLSNTVFLKGRVATLESPESSMVGYLVSEPQIELLNFFSMVLTLVHKFFRTRLTPSIGTLMTPSSGCTRLIDWGTAGDRKDSFTRIVFVSLLM